MLMFYSYTILPGRKSWPLRERFYRSSFVNKCKQINFRNLIKLYCINATIWLSALPFVRSCNISTYVLKWDDIVDAMNCHVNVAFPMEMVRSQHPHKVWMCVCMHEINNSIRAKMAACMNMCMCVVFYCVCIILYIYMYVCVHCIQIYMCIQLYSAKGINDVVLDTKWSL